MVIQMNKTEQKKCTGCFNCVDYCPKKAIKIIEKDGFYYPEIVKKYCIDCGICEKICHLKKKKTPIEYQSIGFQIKNKNKDVLKKSSSGGVFFEIATHCIEQGFYICGAIFSNNKIKHIITKDKKELKKMMGSKYSESHLGGIFKIIKKLLMNGEKVLFSGTPCQCSALRMYLNKKYNNLLIVDLFCMGIPSPIVFEKYCEKLENKYKSKISDFVFRDKTKSWEKYQIRVSFQNGKVYKKIFYNDKYMTLFVNKKIIKQSCYNCGFKKFPRESDITLGDFWESYEYDKEFYDKNGVSLCVINSVTGENLFDEIKNKMYYKRVELSKILERNKGIESPIDKPYNQFTNKNLKEMNFDEIYKMAYTDKPLKKLKNKIRLIYNSSILKKISNKM